MAETVREREQRIFLRIDVAGDLWGSAFEPAGYNEYGSVISPGYKAEDSNDPAVVRVSHKLPEVDLSDPDRLSSDERWALRLEMLERYTVALRGFGWVVEPSGVRPGTSEPWLIVRRGGSGG